MTDVADRRKAELLAGLLIIIVPLGWLSGFVQLALVPHFAPTFMAMSFALTLLTLAYAAARTRRYWFGGVLASVAPLLACAAVAINHPDDHVWYGFMCLGTVLASAFLTVRSAIAVAALTVASTVALGVGYPPLREPSRFVPALALQGILLPAVLLVAHHRERIEVERQAIVASIEQSKRFEALGRLAGGVAHDFNNLLTVILLNSQAARRAYNPERVDEIRSAAERATELVRQLLTFARQKEGNLVVVDLIAVVREVTPILERLLGKDVTLRVEAADDTPLVLIDRVQIEQVLINLVVNARDAIASRGAVELRLRPGDSGDVLLEVQDDGAGMPPSVVARIFEPFFTTKGPGKGTGLGLSTVLGIVEGAGGTIEVSSEVGRGTTFRVRLPGAKQPKPPAIKREEEKGVPGATILLVEDEAPVREVMARVLGRSEHTVIAAGSAEEALALARERTRVDLVVSDVAMRGMSGATLASKLRERWPDVPVLLVSGQGWEGELDGFEVIGKPFAPTVLVRKVSELLRARR